MEKKKKNLKNDTGQKEKNQLQKHKQTKFRPRLENGSPDLTY